MLSKFFINRPIFAIVISIMITVIGLLAMFTLPIAKYPNVTPPQIMVFTTYPGANAEVIGDTVANVIEKQMIGVDNMVNMESSSSDNGSYTNCIQFKTGSNSDMDMVNSQNRISQVTPSLPTEVTNLGVTVKKSASSTALVFSLVSPNNTYDQTFMKNYASQYLMDQLKAVPGVGDVTEFGADYAMRIWMDPVKMMVMKVTPTDVISAVNTQNVQAAVGTIGARPIGPEQQFQYSLRTDGRLKTAEEFGKVVVRTNSDGTMVHLRDIASISLGAESYDIIGSYGGSDNSSMNTSGFMVALTSDANAVETVSGCKKVLEQAQSSFPQDMEYRVTYDSTKFVMASINEVMHTFIEALLLVAIIVFIFLQSWRSTLIPLIAVPVSLLGTFAAFKLLDFSINTLTLFAMVLSIGLLVDDAIVVIEAVEYEIKYNSRPPKEATIVAMQNVQNPVIGVACVLSAVFVPVSFMSGMSGVLYKQFALTIAVSVMFSCFVALTLTPALCGLMLKVYKRSEETKSPLIRFFYKFNDAFDRIVNWYGKILAYIHGKLKLVVVFLVALSCIAAGFLTVIPTGFVPSEDNGFAMVNVTLPEGTGLENSDRTMQKISHWVHQQPGVEETMTITGFNMLAGGQKPNGGVIFLKMADWDQRKSEDQSVDSLVRKIMGYGMQLPEAQVVAINPPPIDGMGVSSGFTMMLENRGGHTTNDLYNTTQKFIAAARKHPEIGTIYTAFTNDTPGFNLDINREQVQKSGVSMSSVYTTLQTYYGGYQINDFTIFGRNFKVMIQADPKYRQTIDDNKFLYVRNSNNDLIPVNNFIQPKPIGAASIITRFNDYPAIKVMGAPAAGKSSGEALKALEEVAQETLGDGYAYEWAGMSREEVEAGNKTYYIFALALLFVFLVLAALYESWKVPFSVLLSVPTGIFGATTFIYLFNQTNNIYFQIGLLAVIGLAAKNAILIIEYAKVRVDERGMDPVSAAIEAAKIRLRPIIMTSLAFVVGCIPLALATGAGAASRVTMGITIVFGTSIATLMGVFVIPMLFIMIENFGHKPTKKKKNDSKIGMLNDM